MPETKAPYLTARTTVRDYVCAKCHGSLIFKHLDDHTAYNNYAVMCADPECKGEGFISKNFVEIREREDRSNYIEAYVNLGKALGISSGKSADELLKELGY